jgi:hypothetical protein
MHESRKKLELFFHRKKPQKPAIVRETKDLQRKHPGGLATDGHG